MSRSQYARGVPRGIVRTQDKNGNREAVAAAAVIPPMPAQPLPQVIPAELTLAPDHMFYEYESGPFVTSDVTMPYNNHWGMVEPLSDEAWLERLSDE